MQVILQALGDRVGKRQHNGVMARCPAHADDNHSLSVQRGDDGRALLNCHAGCHPDLIVDALGLRWKDLMPPADETTLGSPIATYRYTDETGKLLYEVLRYHPKTFRQRRPTGEWGLNGTRRVLYRLHEVVMTPPRAVWVVEGEKDADRLASLGMVATTSGGATSWRPEYAQQLKNRHVMVIPDNDNPGFEYAETVVASLLGIAATVRVVVLPGLEPKQDVSDFVAKGGTRADLEALARKVQPERPLPELRSYLKELEARIRKAEADIKRLAGQP